MAHGCRPVHRRLCGGPRSTPPGRTSCHAGDTRRRRGARRLSPGRRLGAGRARSAPTPDHRRPDRLACRPSGLGDLLPPDGGGSARVVVTPAAGGAPCSRRPATPQAPLTTCRCPGHPDHATDPRARRRRAPGRRPRSRAARVRAGPGPARPRGARRLGDARRVHRRGDHRGSRRSQPRLPAPAARSRPRGPPQRVAVGDGTACPARERGRERGPQHVVRDHDGLFVARGDLWVEGTKVLHEYDGGVHRSQQAHAEDLRRDRALTAAGWTRRGYVAADLCRNPRTVLRDVDATLGRTHRPERIRPWLALLQESTFTSTGRTRLLRRLTR